MERRMLINAIHPEECRIAIVEDNNLIELEIESNLGRKLKGNIYKAKISRIEPSLQAAFIDIGTSRNGFLQINDIHPSYFKQPESAERGSFGKLRIQDELETGQELIVQVVKEERELKGATLTTYLSLPGRYMVLMPGSDRGGISRKISDNEQRKRLKSLSQELAIPTGIGMIIRTAGLDRSLSELSRDLSLQLKVWERVVGEAQIAASPSILYEESDVATRVVRDYFTPEIREIIVDDPLTFERVKEFVGQVMPRYRSRVRLYTEEEPILSFYAIEEQVANTYKSEVKLKSGGAIVIDTLEALVAIDVNSGKATSGGNIEETAYQTNLEAANEIARQLRLRDLGGLIIVDFIDMTDRRNKAAVEQQIQEAIKTDKARIEIGRLSRFGLLEMSRQRLRASLSSQSQLKCPHCQGRGKVRNPELVALEVLRKIQTAVIAGYSGTVKTRLSPSAAMFLLNNARNELYKLETSHKAKVIILADGRFSPDEYELEFESSQRSTFLSQSQTHSYSPILKSKISDESCAEEEEDEEAAEEEEASKPDTTLIPTS